MVKQSDKKDCNGYRGYVVHLTPLLITYQHTITKSGGQHLLTKTAPNRITTTIPLLSVNHPSLQVDPGASISTITVVSDYDAHILLRDWNDTAVNFEAKKGGGFVLHEAHDYYYTTTSR